MLSQRVHAQERPLEDGQRARITLREQPDSLEGHAVPQAVRGTLLRVAPDTLVIGIHPGAVPLKLARSAVDLVEVSGGNRTRLQSALHGVPMAALYGATQWYLLESISESHTFDDEWESLIVGAGVGALVGAVWGAIHPEERWREAT